MFAVRDETKGRDAAASVPGSTEVRRLDLADLASVREFAQGWSGGIHLLINNAGVLMPPLGYTVDGFERQFGINHLGHFALTNLLLPHITGRVVTVASGAHRTGSNRSRPSLSGRCRHESRSSSTRPTPVVLLR